MGTEREEKLVADLNRVAQMRLDKVSESGTLLNDPDGSFAATARQSRIRYETELLGEFSKWLAVQLTHHRDIYPIKDEVAMPEFIAGFMAQKYRG